VSDSRQSAENTGIYPRSVKSFCIDFSRENLKGVLTVGA
jgi:hypothetical protein